MFTWQSKQSVYFLFEELTELNRADSQMAVCRRLWT